MNIKKDKIKPQTLIKTFYREEPGVELPNIQNNITGGSFNQTIIINNPNININYHQGNDRKYFVNAATNIKQKIKQKEQYKNENIKLDNPEGQTSQVKGIQLWTLNKNLKEFSETRQKGFFKNQDKPLISPYAIQKNRTQQIRPVNKVYSNNTIQTIDKSKSKDSKISIPIKLQERSRTISTVKKQTLIPLNNSFYETINSKKKFRNRMVDYKQKTPRQIVSEKKIEAFDPYLRTFINGSLIKKQNSNQNLQIILTKNENQAIHSGRKTQTYMHGHLRKNKFEGTLLIKQEQQTKKIQINKMSQQIQSSKLNKFNDQQNLEEQFRSTSSPSGAYDLQKKQQQKRKQFIYGRTIQKINKSLLKKVEDYFDSFNYSTIPSSKIDFYLNSLKQPEHQNNNHSDYKSVPKQNVRQQYNLLFGFQQQKKKNRPITPYKRKKMYEAV